MAGQQGAEAPPNDTGSVQGRELRGGCCEGASGQEVSDTARILPVESLGAVRADTGNPGILTPALPTETCSFSDRRSDPPAFGRAEGD